MFYKIPLRFAIILFKMGYNVVLDRSVLQPDFHYSTSSVFVTLYFGE